MMILDEYETIAELKDNEAWPDKSNFANSLVPYIKRLKSNPVVLESGTGRGHSAYILLETCPNIAHVHTVDPYKEYVEHNGVVVSQDHLDQTKALAERNLAQFKDRVTMYASDKDVEGDFDFLLIDADNSYSMTYTLMSRLVDRVRPGGYIVVHNSKVEGVNQAIKQIRKENKHSATVNVLPNFWFWQTPKVVIDNLTPAVVEPVKKKYDSHLSIEYLDKYCKDKNVFVETGTYLGETVRLAKEAGFKTIHSIELNEDLCERAKEQFKDDPSIHIWHGDSVDCLPKILETIEGPATFWLDAHASGPLPGGKTGGGPVVDELRTIKELSKSREHTIFIDDRRLFGSAEWSGTKEADAMAALAEINNLYQVRYLDGQIPNDVICAHT
jgi:predicted O-methyltransferase YrrM